LAAPGPGAGPPVDAAIARPAALDQGRRLRGVRPIRVDAARRLRPSRRRVRKPLIGVTMGDPAGVGPEIIVKACAEDAGQRASRPVVIGSAAVMREALGLVGSPLALHAVARVEDCRWHGGTIECLDCANVDVATLPRSAVSAAAGRAAYEYI